MLAPRLDWKNAWALCFPAKYHCWTGLTPTRCAIRGLNVGIAADAPDIAIVVTGMGARTLNQIQTSKPVEGR